MILSLSIVWSGQMYQALYSSHLARSTFKPGGDQLKAIEAVEHDPLRPPAAIDFKAWSAARKAVWTKDGKATEEYFIFYRW
jgi:hypothetical protein